jgi:hypothetical protein
MESEIGHLRWWLLIAGVVFSTIGIAAFALIIQSIEDARDDVKEALARNQEWLFHQLYALAPGKVMKPDEVAPEEKSKPAKIYNPNKDPMREFTGKMDDWFSP